MQSKRGSKKSKGIVGPSFFWGGRLLSHPSRVLVVLENRGRIAVVQHTVPTPTEGEIFFFFSMRLFNKQNEVVAEVRGNKCRLFHSISFKCPSHLPRY